MKSFKHKKFILTLAACAVIAAGIGGTYAILTASTNNVTNTFKPEVIETEIEEDFSGGNFNKKVTIKNIGPDDAFIRARVTISPEDSRISTVGMDSDSWTYYQADGEDEGWYYYRKVVEPGKSTTPLMEKVEVVKAFEGDFDVTVYQEAVGTGSHKANEVVEDVSEIQKFFKAAEE